MPCYQKQNELIIFCIFLLKKMSWNTHFLLYNLNSLQDQRGRASKNSGFKGKGQSGYLSATSRVEWTKRSQKLLKVMICNPQPSQVGVVKNRILKRVASCPQYQEWSDLLLSKRYAVRHTPISI